MVESTLLGPGAAPTLRRDRGRSEPWGAGGMSSHETAVTLQKEGAPADPANQGGHGLPFSLRLRTPEVRGGCGRRLLVQVPQGKGSSRTAWPRERGGGPQQPALAPRSPEEASSWGTVSPRPVPRRAPGASTPAHHLAQHAVRK